MDSLELRPSPFSHPDAVLVGQRFFQDGFLMGLLHPVLVSHLHFLQLDGDLLDFAGELERHLVVFGDRRIFIRSDVRSFVEPTILPARMYQAPSQEHRCRTQTACFICPHSNMRP